MQTSPSARRIKIEYTTQKKRVTGRSRLLVRAPGPCAVVPAVGCPAEMVKGGGSLARLIVSYCVRLSLASTPT